MYADLSCLVLLCRCPFAHFDPETGEKGPSPALKAALSGNAQPKDLMNSALGNPSKSEATACRFGTSCTRREFPCSSLTFLQDLDSHS